LALVLPFLFFFSILKFSHNENPNGEPKELHFSLM
jgi:hypothetical protein